MTTGLRRVCTTAGCDSGKLIRPVPGKMHGLTQFTSCSASAQSTCPLSQISEAGEPTPWGPRERCAGPPPHLRLSVRVSRASDREAWARLAAAGVVLPSGAFDLAVRELPTVRCPRPALGSAQHRFDGRVYLREDPRSGRMGRIREPAAVLEALAESAYFVPWIARWMRARGGRGPEGPEAIRGVERDARGTLWRWRIAFLCGAERSAP